MLRMIPDVINIRWKTSMNYDEELTEISNINLPLILLMSIVK